jgi:hypothetical protein
MKKSIFLLTLSSALFWACNSAPETSNEEMEADSTAAMSEEVEATDNNMNRMEKDGLTVYPAPNSPEFSNAMLTLDKPKTGSNMADGVVEFGFTVANYELGAQTSDAADKGLANSDKGQHIHLIVDNNPYSAHYMPGMSQTFEEGNHYAIAFLSRSYHESVKSPGAAQLFQFSTGKASGGGYDLTQPMLFYSRPKGTYKGAAETQRILFDFYLQNTALSATGNKVVLTVNNKTSFTFDTWKPYIIEGLPMGENTFNIKLVDANGELLKSEVNEVTRTFTLEP